MKVRVIVPDPVAAPRGAEWAADSVVWLLRVMHRAGQALHQSGRAGRPAGPAPLRTAVPAHQRRAA
jgi:hypothetical protein